jgi:hypothetical protein
MKTQLYLVLIFFFVIGCKENTENSDSLAKEMELKNKELELKEKELDLKQKELIYEQSQNSNSDESLSDLYKRVKQSVFLIYTQSDNSVSQGSAFTISNTGIAISNYHVFKDASKAIAINENGEQYMITEIINVNKDEDYIIFRLGNSNDFSSLNIANEVPEIGESCFAIGNPKGLTQTLSTGIISSFRKNKNLIQTTTEITHGSSGGPLFNSKGEVIGITSSGVGEANLNFAINIKSISINSYIETNNSIASNAIDNQKVKNIIENYYQTVQSENWNMLSTIYSQNINRFYDKFNISKNEAISLAKSYNKTFDVINAEYNIRWNTLKVEKSNLFTTASFIMDFNLTRKNKNKPSNFVLNIVMEIDNRGKISGIYENIINQN